MNKKEIQLKRSLIINNSSVGSYLKEKTEVLSKQYGQNISVNQLINQILEEYVARDCLPLYDELEQIHEEIELQNKKIDELTNVLKELIQVLSI